MKRKVFFKIVLLLLLFMSTSLIISCDEDVPSEFTISFDGQSENLYALNQNSKSNRIKTKSKKEILAYKFGEQTQNYISESSELLSLLLQLEVEDSGEIEFSILQSSDLNKKVSKIKQKNSVYGTCPQFLTVGLMLPEKKSGNAAGFIISSTKNLTIHSVQIVGAKTGWSFTQENPWFAFNEKGGKIPSTKEEAQNSQFNLGSRLFDSEKNFARIYFALSNTLLPWGSIEDTRVKCTLAEKTIVLYAEKELHNKTIDTRLFTDEIKELNFTKNPDKVDAVVFDLGNQKSKEEEENSLRPIKIDAGLIQTWPRENWRQKDFELFEWAEFPKVLIFDFANYKIQDDFLKRLAFFVEKTESIGTFVSDEELEGVHGYNAHDYKAESLAQFFDQAEIQSFPLNERELLLKQILLENKIIIKSGNSIIAGKGALISVSQESPLYLRTTFICHEGMHGVFFTTPELRRFIYELFDRTDPESIEFLKAYFTDTPSLNYNIEDEYLLKNEFMAYLLQQNLASCEEYFSDKIAKRYYINQNHPELAQYIQETRAEGLVEAATEIDKFIYEKWGFNNGRTWKVSAYKD
ncbi:MAG: hypothetical protein K6G52_01155 [Treponemataceae bacterium]|nr:hypothetical protein [Treponemataceae bacterium]